MIRCNNKPINLEDAKKNSLYFCLKIGCGSMSCESICFAGFPLLPLGNGFLCLNEAIPWFSSPDLKIEVMHPPQPRSGCCIVHKKSFLPIWTILCKMNARYVCNQDAQTRRPHCPFFICLLPCHLTRLFVIEDFNILAAITPFVFSLFLCVPNAGWPQHRMI